MSADYADTDLKPGTDCPLCGRQIRTWMARQVRVEELSGDDCWLETSNIEPTGISTGFAGNVIFIDHYE